MQTPLKHTVYTIGHSTRSIEEFIALLQSFDIHHLIDIRSFPGSRKFPQFNKENLQATVRDRGMMYTHLSDLGGRRKAKKHSINNRWHNESFRGYADYMGTQNFETGIVALQEIAANQPSAYMCSEAVWWRCHRSLISDYLKAKGWNVQHIMAQNNTEEHPYTSPARVVGDRIFYSDESLFSPGIL